MNHFSFFLIYMFIKKRAELKSKNLKLILEWPRLSVLRFFMVFCVSESTTFTGNEIQEKLGTNLYLKFLN